MLFLCLRNGTEAISRAVAWVYPMAKDEMIRNANEAYCGQPTLQLGHFDNSGAKQLECDYCIVNTESRSSKLEELGVAYDKLRIDTGTTPVLGPRSLLH